MAALGGIGGMEHVGGGGGRTWVGKEKKKTRTLET